MKKRLALTIGFAALMSFESFSLGQSVKSAEELKYPEKCAVCGRPPYNGRMCPYHWVEPGLSGTAFIDDSEIHRFTPSEEKRRFHNDYVRTYKPALSSGKALPQFGRYIDLSGNVTQRPGFLRPIDERLSDYDHKCLDKTTIKLMSGKQAMQWFKRNVTLNQVAKYGDPPSQYVKRLKELGAWTRRLYAECVRYGVLNEAMPFFRKCFPAFNDLYKPAAISEYNSGRSWGELRRGKAKAQRWFYDNATTIELALEDVCDILDDYVEGEYQAWKNNHPEQAQAMESTIQLQRQSANIEATKAETARQRAKMDKEIKKMQQAVADERARMNESLEESRRLAREAQEESRRLAREAQWEMDEMKRDIENQRQELERQKRDAEMRRSLGIDPLF